MSELCGGCLHDVRCHESHNGHFMYCGACFKLCDIVDFNTEHKPTDISKVMEIMTQREHGEYIPNEIKRMSKQEKDSHEQLWSKYE